MVEQVRLAARNNALWCDGMCQAHGQATEFTDNLWICHGTPPRFHSNATTLAPDAEEDVKGLMPPGFKDGFHDIDFTPLGYSCLFEASWIWADNLERHDLVNPWKRVETDAELLRWEHGWAHGDEDAVDHPRQFLPELLLESNNAFVACYKEDTIVAGCIFNLTPPVVGISNTFATGIDRSEMWHDIAVLAAGFQCPVVGYERGDDLGLAVAAGFGKLAPLRVWVS